VRAAVRASLGFNPRSPVIPVARAGGVTSALVVPMGGIISGGAFFVDLAGGREAIGREPAAMLAHLGARGESRAAAMHVVDVALRETLLWKTQRSAWEKAQRAGFATKPLDLEALVPVADGAVPLLVEADRAADLEALLVMLEGTRVRPVILGGAEAWLVRERLAEKRVPVILNPLLFGPGDFDQLRARADNAVLLHAAGVPVILSVFDTHQVRKLRQVAGNAVREGLPWEAALLAVTEAPADAFGMSGHGRIAPGAIGNVVLWSGDPFELATRVVAVFVGGRETSLRTRQTELFERWRRLP
jgi:imidazolonepropionase-like amidohydrolase